MEVRRPRRNFFFVFYSERADAYWVIPSLELVGEARTNKSGANEGCYSIKLASYSESRDELKPRPRFEKYRNRLDLLSEFQG